MKDNLRDFITEHKQEFDTEKVNKQLLWDAIENRLPKAPKKVIPLWKTSVFRIAASIVLLFGLSFSYFMFGISTVSEHTIVQEELLEIDAHYKQLVSAQVALIKKEKKLSKEEKEDFLLFLNDLDAEYNILKLELNENVDNQKVLEAIISNYRKKIELIENLLKRLNEHNNDYNEEEYIL